jgi:integrase
MTKRAKKLGVRKRGERWQARPYISGVGHVWAGTHDTEEEAIEAAEAKIAEHETRPARRETIASFSERWIRDYPRPKESTNDGYEGSAKRFRERVDPNDKRKLHEYTVPEALAYARAHRQDAKNLRAMFSDARREGLVKENSFTGLGLPKSRGRKDIIAITAEELDMLIEIAIDVHGVGVFGQTFAAIIEWGAATTMRPGEIFGLDRTDLNLKQSQVQVMRQFHKRRIQLPKNGSTRVLPFIPPRGMAALQRIPRRVPPAICEETKGEILFPGKRGQRISQQALLTYWVPVRAAFEAKLEPHRRGELRAARSPESPGMDFYELRHFGATEMAERNVEDWVGAEMMGHEDGGKLFRDLYSHPANKVAGQRLKRAFGQNVKPLRSVDVDQEKASGA